MWLAHSPMDVECEQRRGICAQCVSRRKFDLVSTSVAGLCFQYLCFSVYVLLELQNSSAGVAAEILSADLSDGDTDVNILVLMDWCPDAIRHASETGTCKLDLFALVKLVRRLMKADVQANERMNSLISANIDFAPNIGLPLLDARTRIKQELQLGTRGAATKWSIIQPRAELVMKTALQHLLAGQVVESNPLRYSTAHPSVDLPSLSDSKKTPEAKWAAASALRINKQHAELAGELGINFALKIGKNETLTVGDVLHVCVDKYYAVWTTVEFQVAAEDSDGCAASLRIPLRFA